MRASRNDAVETNGQCDRQLKISDELRREIQSIRAALGLVGATELRIERLEYHEALLGATLSDAIVAVFLGLERDLEEIHRLTAEAKAKEALPSRYIAFADDEMEGGYWCVPRSPSNPKGPVLKYSRALGLRGGLSMLSYLRARKLGAETPVRALPPFEARLFGESKRIRQRIFHQQFGYGEVRRVIDGPRRALEIEFEDSGIRRVLAKYVENL